jgi:hypothetical protein
MRSVPLGVLHPERMKQRDLKNPSCRISSEMRQEKSHQALQLAGGARGGASYYDTVFENMQHH